MDVSHIARARVLRRGHNAGRAGRAYAVVRLLAWTLGAPRRPYETPRELGERLATRLPRYAEAIRVVVDAYVVSRYARHKTLDSEAAARVGAATFEPVLADLREVGELNKDSIGEYMDWDKTVIYKVERGEGECAI